MSIVGTEGVQARPRRSGQIGRYETGGVFWALFSWRRRHRVLRAAFQHGATFRGDWGASDGFRDDTRMTQSKGWRAGIGSQRDNSNLIRHFAQLVMSAAGIRYLLTAALGLAEHHFGLSLLPRGALSQTASRVLGAYCFNCLLATPCSNFSRLVASETSSVMIT